MAHCTDPALRAPMAAAARDLALRHGMDQNVAAIESVYRECMSPRRGGNGKS
jgi:hypothetical protein